MAKPSGQSDSIGHALAVNIGGRPAMVFTLHDCRRVDSRQKPQNSKKNDTSVNVNTVNTLENDNPQPPDYDRPPVAYLEQQAAAELDRQAQVSEADV